MKNTFYFCAALGALSLGQVASAGWYDTGQSVLVQPAQQPATMPLNQQQNASAVIAQAPAPADNLPRAIVDSAPDSPSDDPPQPVPEVNLGASAMPPDIPAVEPGPPPPPTAEPLEAGTGAETPSHDSEPMAIDHQPMPVDNVPMLDPSVDSVGVMATEMDPLLPVAQSDGVESTVPNEPQPHYHYYRVVKKKKSCLQKMVDLERRKQAWIKQKLFGR